MRRLRALLAALALALLPIPVLTTGPALAIDPDEQLEDPALETRAREISRELRCVVCQSQSIDESNASMARDLRLIVRERLVAGDTDEEVVDYVVGRYGEYVLLAPRAEGRNLMLWGAPLIFIVLGGVFLFTVLRHARGAPIDDDDEPGESAPRPETSA